MKTCPQCGRTFSDIVKQCPACGRVLDASENRTENREVRNDIPNPPPISNIQNQAQPTPTINPAQKTGNSSIKDTVTDMEQKPGLFNQWFGTIVTVLSLLITWEMSMLFGSVLAVAGIIAGLSSSNNVNKVISVIVGAISICLSIMTYILLS